MALKIKMFFNKVSAEEWLKTDPIIRHIHVTESDSCWTVTYHYEE